MSVEFPRSFVRDRCPQVLEARIWRRHFGVEEVDDTAYAECAFNPAGMGMRCESCQKFIDEDTPWFSEVKKFYEDAK